MIDRQFYTMRAPITLGDLADQFRADLPSEGMRDELISSVASLSESRAGDVTFFCNVSQKPHLSEARATACLTTEALSTKVSATGMVAIICDNPRAAFARLSSQLVHIGGVAEQVSYIPESASIHPSAVIESGVTIGERTRIGANTVIEDGVIIGSDCEIEPLVRVAFARVGDRCHFKAGVIIGGAGFGMVQHEGKMLAIPHLGRVMVGNDVHIGSNSCIDRGQLGDTIISDDVKIDNQVQVGHNTTIGEGTVIAGQAGISGSCKIGKNVRLAGRAMMADHVEIGDGATLAVNSLAMKNIPEGGVYFGAPATPIREQMRSLVAFKKLATRK